MVVLRQVEDGDLDPFFEHWNDDDALQMAAFTPADAKDRAAFDERWTRMRNSRSVLLRTIELAGRPVGSIGSWDNDGQREVTYWIGRAHWGKGIATDALRAFLALEGTRPLHAATAADNLGSQRVLSKCGFRVVGSGRGYANARGAEVDEVLFQLDG